MVTATVFPLPLVTDVTRLNKNRLLDDDVYVNWRGLEQELGRLDMSANKLWGTPGCGTCPNGKPGLCGGGGYAVSIKTAYIMAGDFEHFKSSMLQYGKAIPGEYCDVAVVCAAYDVGGDLGNIANLNPWNSGADQLFKGFHQGGPALSFHYSDGVRMATIHKYVSVYADLGPVTHEDIAFIVNVSLEHRDRQWAATFDELKKTIDTVDELKKTIDAVVKDNGLVDRA